MAAHERGHGRATERASAAHGRASDGLNVHWLPLNVHWPPMNVPWLYLNVILMQ
jgi:hypothetical protein